MSRLIVQADDLAITHAATLGILDGITNGMVRTTGIFTNRPDAAFAADQVAGIDGVDVGIDINFVTGSPLLPASEVPTLVTGEGRFRTSHEIKAEFPVKQLDGPYMDFEVEPFDHDQTLAEARAQVERFISLFGHAPAYVHHHSLSSTMVDQVLHEVAAEQGVIVVDDLLRTGELPWVGGMLNPPLDATGQAAMDLVAWFEPKLEQILATEVSILITHPGYVDAELLGISSFHLIRLRDHELVTSPRIMKLLADNGVEVVSYTNAGIDLKARA